MSKLRLSALIDNSLLDLNSVQIIHSLIEQLRSVRLCFYDGCDKHLPNLIKCHLVTKNQPRDRKGGGGGGEVTLLFSS